MAVGFLTLGIGVAFAAVKGDVNPGLLQLLSVIFGAFVVGNGFEHIANSRKPAPSAVPTLALNELSDKVNALQAAIDETAKASGTAVAEIKALAEQAATGSAAAAEALMMIIKLYKIDEVYAKQQATNGTTGGSHAQGNAGV